MKTIVKKTILIDGQTTTTFYKEVARFNRYIDLFEGFRLLSQRYKMCWNIKYPHGIFIQEGNFLHMETPNGDKIIDIYF